MRLNEIAQLWVHDIKQEHGIWIFDLQEGDGQRLKTKAATRKVPIHSKLIEAGLIKYVETLPKDGGCFLHSHHMALMINLVRACQTTLRHIAAKLA